MRARARSGAALLGLAVSILLGASEAAAQTAVCSDTPGTGQRIACEIAVGAAGDIAIDAKNLAISTTGSRSHGVHARHRGGDGSIEVAVTGGSIETADTTAYGVYAHHQGGEGEIGIDLTRLAIKTRGFQGAGVRGYHQGDAGGVAIDVTGGSIETSGSNAHGVLAWRGSGRRDELPDGDIAVSASDLSITTEGSAAYGVLIIQQGAGDSVVRFRNVDVETKTDNSYGVSVSYSNGGYLDMPGPGAGDALIDVEGGSIKTTGDNSYGVHAFHQGHGNIGIEVTNGAVTTSGDTAYGVFANHENLAGGTGDVRVRVTGGSVGSSGRQSSAVHGRHAGRTGDVDVEVRSADVTASGSGAHGVYGIGGVGSADYVREGDVRIRVSDASVKTDGSSAVVASRHAGVGAISVHLTRSTLETKGDYASGVSSSHHGEGDALLDISGGSIATTGDVAYGVRSTHRGEGDVLINVSGGAVSTTNFAAHGVFGYQWDGNGDIAIGLKNGASVRTAGEFGYGVFARAIADASGIRLALDGAVIATEGADASGVFADHWKAEGAGDIAAGMTGGSVSTAGAHAHGVIVRHRGAGGIAIDLNDAGVGTAGDGAHGVWGYVTGAENEAGVSISVTGGSVATAGASSQGVLAYQVGGGRSSIDLSGAAVSTEGDGAGGVLAYVLNQASASGAAIHMTGGSISTEGLSARGAYGLHRGLGSVTMTTAGEAAIKAPFFVGAEARLTNDANAAGRLLVTHRGAIEARNAGVLAWAARASGSTFGEGTRTADDASRTEPMIHVTSGGDVTVGADVTDAFIRNRVAGEDGTLSTGERAVLYAITAGDSDALEAALAALPASYADDYGAEARNLLRKRSRAPTTASALANQAADEILDLPRAGVRALALSHHAIADHVRSGDADPALTAIAANDRTEEQRAALAAQALLSTAERAALEAALTDGDLEAALAALPAAYSDEWKDGVRRRAMSYNAGDVRADVTGGTITSDGDGVHAGYALTRDRNGSVTVNVAEGARVEGGRHGLYLSGGGRADGNFRAQSAWVDGVVTGGTGAGVYMRGGGRFVVGPGGRVGADSGLAFLSDGPGDLDAAVLGRVEGDIRGMGPGNHAVTVSYGAVVTGTIHLAASEVRVDGSAGAVRFDRGGMITLGPTGRIGGVAGVAARATGDMPRLRFGMSLSARHRVRDVIGDAWIINDGGRTDIFVNGVKLHDGTTGATGRVVQVGARDVTLRPSAIIRDRDFSAEDFVEPFAPRAASYEELPGLLNLLSPPKGPGGVGPGSGRRPGRAPHPPGGAAPARGAPAVPGEEELSFPGSPVWVRLSGARGSGAGRSTVDAKREFDRFEAEAGAEISLPWTRGLSVWGFIRLARGASTASLPNGEGKTEMEGLGFGAGLSWRSGDGWYLNGGLSTTDYLADFSSKSLGRLKSGVGAVVRSLDLEAGRRLTPGGKLGLAPRAWLARSEVSVEDFTDAVGTRFSLVNGNRLSGGAGLLAEALRPLAVGGGRLSPRGSLDVEGILSGDKTTVEVSGERLHSGVEKTRVLLGLGARWRMGRFSVDADLSVAGLGSSAREYAGGLTLGWRF